MARRGPLKLLAPALLGLLLGALALTGCMEERPTFKVGFMICNSLGETRARFDPLMAYLSQNTGAEFEPVYIDTVDVEEEFKKGGLDFTHTNSLLFVTLAERDGVELVASEKRGAFGALTRGTIIVRADSPIKTLADLKGKRLVFGPQWAPFGFLSQYALLLENGVDPELDLGPYSFPPGSWKHEKIIYSVLYGAYDAGAAPLIDLEEMALEGRITPEDFRVIAESPLAPYCTFGAAPSVDPKWRDELRRALLAIGPDTTAEVGGEKVLVLKAAKVDGFEKLDYASYATLLEWARRSHMPPYEETYE